MCYSQQLGFKGNIVQHGDERIVSGILNYGYEQFFDVSGSFRMHKGLPASMHLELTPISEEGKILIEYFIQNQQTGYAIQMVMTKGNITLSKIELHLSRGRISDWNIHLEVLFCNMLCRVNSCVNFKSVLFQIVTSLDTFRNAMISAQLIAPSSNNVTFSLNATTPFNGFQNNRIIYSIL